MITYHCPYCDSTNVLQDAYVDMNDTDNVITYDNKVCYDCGKHFDMAVEKDNGQPEPVSLREFTGQLLTMVRDLNAGYPWRELGISMEQVETTATRLGVKP